MNLKRKNSALFAGILLLFWVAYQFSFSNMFKLRKQYHTLKKEQEFFTNVSQKLIQLRRQDIYYDSILKSKKITTKSSFQNNLLKTITDFADATSIKIITFNDPHIFKIENAIFNSYSFTLRGDFSKITQLIYELEQHNKLGKIISVNYIKKKNYRRNNYFLECTVLLQQVQQG